MRKWMRERLTRRKKKDPEEGSQPGPAPLQPAYFDAEESPSPAPKSEREAEAAAPQAEVELQPTSRKREDAQSAERPSEEAQPRTQRGSSEGRTRRRRGGRGRGGRGREQAVAQAFSPAVVKGSIPATPAEQDAAESGDAEVAASSAVAAAPKIPAAAAAAQRPPKGLVVLAIGLPGSGKSTWFKRHSVVPLSSDMVRSLLFDDVREQRFQDLVFSNLRSMLKARLIAKRPMNYVDATNLTPQERQHWIKLAKDYGYEVHAVFFDVPLEVCIERHGRRDRVVPEDVMRRMAAKLKAPAFTEGFAKITVVRVKKKEE